MTGSYLFTLTEEFVRFCFEVHLKTKASPAWVVGFTNPTAGPWKKIMLPHDKGKIEIGRYERDEERPDFILFNQSKGVCIVLEAKDIYEKVASASQMVKNISVYKKEKRRLLASKQLNEWVNSNDVLMINGLLWSRNKNSLINEGDINDLYNKYKAKQDNDSLCAIQVIEDNKDLCCSGMIITENDRIRTAFDELQLNSMPCR